jgi:hypothetical protein
MNISPYSCVTDELDYLGKMAPNSATTGGKEKVKFYTPQLLLL